MNFSYRGFDASGKAVSGQTDAPGIAEAFDLLRRQGVFATTVTETQGPPTAHAGNVRVGLRDLTAFCRQLAILVTTKTPLIQALGVVERQTAPGPWRAVIADLARRVEEGSALSAAMEHHPRCFDAVLRSMVAAGESGGMLDAMLRDVAALMRRQMGVRKTVIGALSYPVILIGVSVVVVVTMLTFVLPQFRELFESLQAPLPPTTKVLMKLGIALREYWWAVLAGLAACATGFWAWLRTPAARDAASGLLLSFPHVGPMVRAFSTARIARLLGVLLQARVALLDALRLTGEACGHSRYATLLLRAQDAVSKGQSLALVLSDPKLIAPAVSEALASGERSGQMGLVLVQVADYLDEDNDQIIKSLASILEPLVLTFLGVIVGVVAVSMFLPLFDLTAAGNQGGTP